MAYFSPRAYLAQMRGMVLIQITLSFVVAMGFAILIDEGMQWLLAGQLENVTTKKPDIDHIIAIRFITVVVYGLCVGRRYRADSIVLDHNRVT
jgi:hypothetical protein